MAKTQDISKLIQAHMALDQFEYDVTIDWAIDLIEQGKETENILILASFSKPVDAIEIRPYVNSVLLDLGLDERKGDDAVNSKIQFHLIEIINENQIRKNLNLLYKLFLDKDCFSNDDKYGLMPFYLLYHGWDELESIGVNYYFEGADLNNIEEVIQEQATNWIDKFGQRK
jgi:hypothetical protein